MEDLKKTSIDRSPLGVLHSSDTSKLFYKVKNNLIKFHTSINFDGTQTMTDVKPSLKYYHKQPPIAAASVKFRTPFDGLNVLQRKKKYIFFP